MKKVLYISGRDKYIIDINALRIFFIFSNG